MPHTTFIEIVSTHQPGNSSMSLRSRQGLEVSLRKTYTHVRITMLDTLEDVLQLVARKPDMVFLGASHIRIVDPLNHSKSDLWLTSYIEGYGIACTGSPSAAHTLEGNKTFAKDRVLSHGVATSNYVVVPIGNTLPMLPKNMQFPVFIKPSSLGGGQGVDMFSVAHTMQETAQKILAIHTTHSCDALIEEYLSGKEFSVGILRIPHSSLHRAMPLELIAGEDTRGNRMLSNRVKSGDLEQAIAVTDLVLHAEVSTLAQRAFKALGGRDYGRIDIRYNTSGTPYFLEANLIPSVIENYGSFPKSCATNENLSFDEMVSEIVTLTLHRTTATVQHRRISAVKKKPLQDSSFTNISMDAIVIKT